MPRNCIEIEVYVEILQETDLAYRVDDGSNRKEDVWIPKSQVSDRDDDRTTPGLTCLTIPEWLAIEKGLE